MRFVDTQQIELDLLLTKAIDGLLRIYNKLGRPPGDINSPTFWIMLDQVVNMWSVIFPNQVKDMEHDVNMERSIERSLKESVTGGFKASVKYPDKLYSMVKVFFPELNLADKKFTRNFLTRYPNFNASNYT